MERLFRDCHGTTVFAREEDGKVIGYYTKLESEIPYHVESWESEDYMEVALEDTCFYEEELFYDDES